MNTLMFCTSLINEQTLKTYSEWWKYYRNKFPDCDFLLFNDGPIETHIADKLFELTNYEMNWNNIVVFDDKLGREGMRHWGWWRSFLSALNFGRENYDKIIHVECDAVILSLRLFDFIHNTNNGWCCLFTNKYNFPESAIQIINKDSYVLIDRLSKNFDFNVIAELVIPFRPIKAFVGDRWGEDGALPTHKVDYVCQWNWEWHIDKDWIL